MRTIALFCFILVVGPSMSPSLMMAAAGARPSASGIGAGTSSSCRCAPDQFEAVLRTVEREIDLHAGLGIDNNSPMSETEFEDYDMTIAAAAGVGESREDHGGGGGDGSSNQLLQSGVPTAESESTTSVYYDYTNGLLVTIEHGEQIKTIVNHAAGVQYTVDPEGTCHRTTVTQRMKKMCLPDGAVLMAKFSLGVDLPVSLWRFIGPNNSTLRTMVERRRCIPIFEETSTSSDGYASLTSIVYSNVRVGIRDRRVFNLPASCQQITDDGRKESAVRAPPAGDDRN